MTTGPTYQVPQYPTSDHHTDRPAPTSIRVLRWSAIAQAVLCLVGAAVSIWLASTISRDQDWADLAQFLYGVAAIYNLVNALLLLVPALLIKQYSNAPRLTILVVDGITAGLTLAVLPIALGDPRQLLNNVYLGLYAAGAIAALVAGTRPSARFWSARQA